MTADVVVVGAGPVGLTAALGLARAGLKVTVIEREDALNDRPRAGIHHWCVLPFLESLGILEDAEATGFRGRQLAFKRPATGETVTMNAEALDGVVDHPYSLHLGQGALGRIVLAHLSRYSHADVRFRTEFRGLSQTGDVVTVRIGTPEGEEEIRAGWVIGTDGARSSVRQELGLGFEGTTWAERFVATDIRYDFPRHGYLPANMVIDPEHGAVVAELDKQGLWRCTFSEDDSLPLDGIEARIESFFDTFLPDRDGLELVRYSPYRMHQRAATTFRAGRVLLAGDAAHATNPCGGMGLTSGLFDVETLADALPAVIKGEAPDEVLDRYSERRRTAFLDIASPVASQYKQLIYSTADTAVVDAFLASMRQAESDAGHARERYLSFGRSRTGSVLAG